MNSFNTEHWTVQYARNILRDFYTPETWPYQDTISFENCIIFNFSFRFQFHAGVRNALYVYLPMMERQILNNRCWNDGEKNWKNFPFDSSYSYQNELLSWPWFWMSRIIITNSIWLINRFVRLLPSKIWNGSNENLYYKKTKILSNLCADL